MHTHTFLPCYIFCNDMGYFVGFIWHSHVIYRIIDYYELMYHGSKKKTKKKKINLLGVWFHNQILPAPRGRFIPHFSWKLHVIIWIFFFTLVLYAIWFDAISTILRLRFGVHNHTSAMLLWHFFKIIFEEIL